MDALQGGTEVCFEVLERAPECRAAGDQDVVKSWPGCHRQIKPGKFPQAALGSVAEDSIPDPPRCREAGAGRVPILSVSRLKDKARHGRVLGPRDGHEILPAPETVHARGSALGREALAALGAAAGQNIAAADGGHTRAEAMAALANELGRLESTLHVLSPCAVFGNDFNDINHIR